MNAVRGRSFGEPIEVHCRRSVAILSAVRAIGHAPQDVVEITLTHFHRDHTGALAELCRRTGARVLAHTADAGIIEGREPPLRPHLTPLEYPLAEMLLGDIENLPGPCTVIDWLRTAT